MRAFFAIDLDSPLREAFAVELGRLRKLAPDARWVRPESLHLTLAFLGEVPDAAMEGLRKTLMEVTAKHPPFRLQAADGGIFGALECPKVLWVALRGDLDQLHRLQAELSAQLSSAGHVPDFERFEPHVTLARAKQPRGDVALARCADALRGSVLGELQVSNVALFSSGSDVTGMRYSEEARCTLGVRAVPYKPARP